MKSFFLFPILIFVSGMFIGCASVDQRVNLTYDKYVNAGGGSGELFIATPVETHSAVKRPSGEIVIGIVKGSDRKVVTTSDIGYWVMNALTEELRTAGYSIKTVNKIPENAPKGLNILLSRIDANQTNDLVTVTTEAHLNISAEIWKNGNKIHVLNVRSDNEKKGIERSAETIAVVLKETLQNALKDLVPRIINKLEH